MTAEPLLPGVPGELISHLTATYGHPELARRALWAPIPYHRFRSAYSMRRLWEPGASEKERRLRQRIEQRLAEPLYAPAPILRSPDEPFFPAAGTGGSLLSPYPEVPHDFYWLVHLYCGQNERRTARTFERRSAAYLGLSLLELAGRGRPQLSSGHLWYRYRLGKRDWRQVAYSALRDDLLGVLGR